MIFAHQPTIFGPKVVAALSSKKNGSMKLNHPNGDADIIKNRVSFLKSIGIHSRNATLVGVSYDTDDFARYRIVEEDEKGIGIHDRENVIDADALVTHSKDHALFLPLADCVGAILYDEEHEVLMVSHLGRHSTEIEGAKKSVVFLREHYKTDATKLRVWLSPGVGSATYPLHAFNGKSLHEVIESQLQTAGVSQQNIENATINTAESSDYYSHSEFLKGNDEFGRFAIVAMMTEQGEPA